MPQVSVIIPAFNAACTVRRAVESAQRQKGADIEVIVVDDGSTDDTIKLIESMERPPRLIRQANSGGCIARNRGLAESSSEYIQFLDADDELLPGKIEASLEAFQRQAVDLVFCNGLVFRRDEQCGNYCASFLNSLDPLEFVTNYPLPTPAPLHRRSVLASVGGFDPTFPCSQERDLHVRLAAIGKRFFHIPVDGYKVHRQAGSVSSDVSRVFRQHSRIVEKSLALLTARHADTEPRRSWLAAMAARAGRQLVRLGSLDDARQAFQVARAAHRGGGISDSFGWRTAWLANLIGPLHAESWLATLSRRKLNPCDK